MARITCLFGRNLRICLILLSVLLVSAQAEAQLRIVSYNTTGPPAADIDIILRSIGEQTLNGIAKPIDVLLLQEQNNPSPGLNSPSPNTEDFVTLLNNMYTGQGVTYSMSNSTGFGNDTQTLVYRTETVHFEDINTTTVGTTSLSGQPRQALRYQLRPIGYDASADFYIYNSHYKASQGTDCGTCTPNAVRRDVEATAIRDDSNGLGNSHVIYTGDHNFYDHDADEPAWGTLVAAGDGQASDPINRVGTWHNNASFADIHTQSPCDDFDAGDPDCPLVNGGMDDRFDFQLVTGEFLDGEGLSYIGPTVPGMSGLAHSYQAFGNNGTTYDESINEPSNTVTFPGVTSHSQSQILNALRDVSDHIPVVADYQVPAIMDAIAGTVPTLTVGQLFNLGVTVSNVANVVAAIGADELDYSLATSGSVSGSFLNQVATAMSSGNMHFVTLDTSTPGLKSGLITVTSSSQQAFNALVQIPVNYEVLSSGPQPIVVAKWTFEAGATGNPPAGSGTNISNIGPAMGAGTASGHHASASTAWSSPSGNGSDESFSSNNWAVGDYYQFEISTDGLTDISLTLDHASSNSGPKEWGVFYSTTGIGDFTDTGMTYSVLANAMPNPVWNSGTYLSQYFQNLDLSEITALDDQATLFLRLVSISNVSANGGTVAGGGTSRVDNVTIFGTPIVGLPGDFNHDGVVDAADYVVWRKTGINDAQGYEDWRANFGMPSPGSGAGAVAGSLSSAVPEPCSLLLVVMGVCLVGMARGTLKG